MNIKIKITASVTGGYDSENVNLIILETTEFATIPAAHAAAVEAFRDSDHGYATATVDVSYLDGDGEEEDFDGYTVATRHMHLGEPEERIMHLSALISTIGAGIDDKTLAEARV